MIRGVSRFSVEVKGTGSPYFERAICFVRPQYAREERLDLHRAALSMMNRLDAEVEAQSAEVQNKPSARRLRRLYAALPLIIAALSGAAAALLLCLLL